jgi:hypothetical protein
MLIQVTTGAVILLDNGRLNIVIHVGTFSRVRNDLPSSIIFMTTSYAALTFGTRTSHMLVMWDHLGD